MNRYFSKLFPFLVGSLILIVLCSLFLAPQLSGKVLYGESVQTSGMIKEADNYYKKHHEFTFWTNSIFSGMPTYVMYGGGKAGVLDYMASGLKLFRSDSLGYFILVALASYLGLIFFGMNPWIALFGAIVSTFASTHIGVLEAGHNSKLASASFSILVLAGIYRLFKREYMLGGLAFALGLSLSIALGHPQMTYYFLLASGMLILFYTIDFIRQKDFRSLGIIFSILLGASLISLSTNLYQSMVVRKFAADTMRGGSILSTDSKLVNEQGISKSGDSGLGYDYAMGWSDGLKDLMAFIIPGAVGGSNGEKVKGNTKIDNLLKSNGIQSQDILPLYWGDLTFTASPDYLGGITILVFILGLFYSKGPLKWGLIGGISLLVLMSLGKNFDIFNRFLFEYLPMLNKFRTPNSIHNVSVCIMAIFAALGLQQFLATPDKVKAVKVLLKVTGGILIYILLFGFGGSLFFDFTSVSDSRYDPKVVAIFKEARSIYLTQDSLRTLLFVISGCGVLYLYLKDKLMSKWAVSILCLLTIIDLFGVGKRYISAEDWKPASSLKNPVVLRACDKQILEDKTLHYRVFDLTGGDPFQSSSSGNFHKLIGGYNPAKFRRYQDIIDAYLSKGDEKMLNMLNAKYIISQNEQVVPRSGAFGNAWFVNNIKFVNSPDEEIVAINSIDPLQTAVLLESEFPGYVNNTTNYSKSGSISLTAYEPNLMTYKSNAEGDQFAVFSEVWYDSGKGWEAYIDGKPVKHVRVDYILRGLKIPAGSHTIEFKFFPKPVLTAINLSFWINNLIGLLFLGIIGWWFYNDYKKFQLSPKTIVETKIASKADTKRILVHKKK